MDFDRIKAAFAFCKANFRDDIQKMAGYLHTARYGWICVNPRDLNMPMVDSGVCSPKQVR